MDTLGGGKSGKFWQKKKPEDEESRYSFDLDRDTGNVLGWGYDQFENRVKLWAANPSHHRACLTKGQVNKLVQKSDP